MIHAYAITEEDIWGKHYKRLERDEFLELLETSTFFIALEDEKILGSIQVYQKDASTFGFGLLNVDFEHTGKNIGALLINASEDFVLEKGGKIMQLEVLRVEQNVSDFKKWLHKWYKKLGYSFIETVTFETIETTKLDKHKIMKAHAVFDVFQKSLS
jgi:GNAT superfamily N-acetyltransferase